MDLLEIKAESLEYVTSVGAKITYIVSVLNGNLLQRQLNRKVLGV